MRLGYIGLGSMGGAMARNLALAGHDLTVFDLDPDRIESLAASGARPASSGEQLAAGATCSSPRCRGRGRAPRRCPD
jgi:3-hydroxyisobutyrate dehydrogenase-like beta-hydroxyacid dehydrogenase